MVRRIFEFCKPYEKVNSSKAKPGVGSVDPGQSQGAEGDTNGWNQMQDYTDEQWAAWDSVMEYAAFKGVQLNMPQEDGQEVGAVWKGGKKGQGKGGTNFNQWRGGPKGGSPPGPNQFRN